jgi:hypothetical protein
MRRSLPLTLLLINCLPLTSPDGGTYEGKVGVTVENQYAESIFTVDVTPDGGTPVRAFDQADIAGSDSQTMAGALSAAEGTQLFIAADVISLGEHHRFTGSVVTPSFSPTLRLVYDYDLALADFRLRIGWIP